jgi:uncharacterized protein (DUF433 family)
MGGKPVIQGTHIPVEHILKKLGRGETYAEVLADFPHMTEEDIQAAQALAASFLAREEIVFASGERL